MRTFLLLSALVAAFLFPAQAHDIYTNWQQPTNGVSCCSGDAESGDCDPTEAEFNDGQWFALRREDRKWLAVPDSAVLKDGATADGKAHLCAPRPYYPDDNRIYCFRPPWSGG